MKKQLALFLAVAFVGVTLWMTLRRSPQQHTLSSRALATEMLGRALAKSHPGARALVVSNPFAQQSGRRHAIQDVEQAGIDGLKRGLEDSITVEEIVFPDIHPDAAADPRSFASQLPTTDTPLSYLVAEDAYDQMAATHPECSVIVSLIGIPAHLEKIKCWNKSGPPHFAFLLPDLRMLGGRDAMVAALKSGKIAAFVIEKPGAPPPSEPLRASSEEEANSRFLLVTADNVGKLIQSYPDRFDIQPLR